MLQAVYVLVSSEKDYYAEQALMSMYSLKCYNPNTRISLVTDIDTTNSFKGHRADLKNYADELIAIDVPSDFTPAQKSRYLKTSLTEYINTDFIYLDNDTVITAPLADLNSLQGPISAAYNKHNPYSHRKSPAAAEYVKITGRLISDDSPYYNGGILLVRNTLKAQRFFNDWHNLWKEDNKKFGILHDQVTFVLANKKNNGIVGELPPEYNCQILSKEAINYLINAKIIHYWSESPIPFYPFKSDIFLNRIRENGITDEVAMMIKDVKTLYLLSGKVLNGLEYELYNSPMAVVGRKISKKYKWVNPMVRYIANIFSVKI